MERRDAPAWRSMIDMSRRIDSITAERLSIALLTRAAFGAQAGLRAALSYGVHAPLVQAVFARTASEVRIDASGSNNLADRRKEARDVDR